MSLLFSGKALANIEAHDLQRLIDIGLTEGRTVEFKRELSSDASREKILSTMVAFANSSGGTLVIGIEADDGVPKKLVALVGAVSDREKLALESVIRDRVEPPLRFDIHAVELFDGPVLIVEVPRSWRKPHVLRGARNSYAFYTRNSAGNQPMDFSQMRDAIIGSQSAIIEARSFRSERIAALHSHKLDFELVTGPKYVLHLVPLESFASGFTISLEGMRREGPFPLPLFVGGAAYERPTLNGFLTYMIHPGKPVSAYTEIYRNGCVEVVVTNPTVHIGNDREKFNGSGMARQLMTGLNQLLAIYRGSGVVAPAVLMLTIVGTGHLELFVGNNEIFAGGREPADGFKAVYSLLRVPEILIEDFNADASQILKPALDIVWNAWGLDKCSLYGADGKLRADAFR